MPERWRAAVLTVCLALAAAVAPAAAQSIDVDRQRGRQMLDQIRADLVEHYYDPAFRGLDLDAVVARARQRIASAASLGEIFGVLGGVCLDVKDSHVWFLPPRRVQQVDYGWTWQAVGDRMLVASVAGGSDAATTIGYLLWELRPQSSLAVVIERDGARRRLTLASRFYTRPARLDLDDDKERVVFMFQEFEDDDDWHPWLHKLAKDVLYVRFPRFLPEPERFEGFGRDVHKARAVVLDLRGNPGGHEGALQAAGALFAPDAELITRVTRQGRTVVRTSKGDKPFTGDVVVLVDSETASAGEVLARFLQLRGARVIGDRTSGHVTNGRVFPHTAGEGAIKVIYRVQVAVADGILPDGKRLEGVGVTPDIPLLPTPDDLLGGRDPVLLHAASLVGVTLDPANPFAKAR